MAKFLFLEYEIFRQTKFDKFLRQFEDIHRKIIKSPIIRLIGPPHRFSINREAPSDSSMNQLIESALLQALHPQSLQLALL